MKRDEKAEQKRHHSKELIKMIESYKKCSKQNELLPAEKPSLNTSSIGIKMVIFLIIGLVALYYVMLPTRKF